MHARYVSLVPYTPSVGHLPSYIGLYWAFILEGANLVSYDAPFPHDDKFPLLGALLVLGDVIYSAESNQLPNAIIFARMSTPALVSMGTLCVMYHLRYA